MSLLSVLAFIFTGGLPSVAQAAADCPERVRIGYLPDWPPYQYTGSDGLAEGIDVEAARRVIAAAGCAHEFVVIGWPRVMSLLERGVVDMVAGISATPDREGIARFSAPYRRERIGLFVRPGDSRVYPLSSLAEIEFLRFRLGVTAGAYYGDEFLRLMSRPQFRAHVTEVQGADTPALVAIGRVDGYLMDVMTADSLARSAVPPLTLEQHPGVLIDNGPIHFAFNRTRISPALVARIDVLLSVPGAVRDDGTSSH